MVSALALLGAWMLGTPFRSSYVQERDIPSWAVQFDDWIDGLESDAVEDWSAADKLSLLEYDPPSRVAGLASAHARSSGLGGIRLDHLWIEM